MKGVLPQCARQACRKLFHGVRMQGYQSTVNKRIFVHYECLDAVISGENVIEVPEEGIHFVSCTNILYCKV